MAKIDLALATQLVDNYKQTRKNLIDKNYGIDDTVSIWFSAADVLALAQDLTAGVTGVRVYLGAYDHNYPQTPNQTTIIAIGTVRDSTGKDVDAIMGILDEGLTEPPPRNLGKLCPPYC